MIKVFVSQWPIHLYWYCTLFDVFLVDLRYSELKELLDTNDLTTWISNLILKFSKCLLHTTNRHYELFSVQDHHNNQKKTGHIVYLLNYFEIYFSTHLGTFSVESFPTCVSSNTKHISSLQKQKGTSAVLTVLSLGCSFVRNFFLCSTGKMTLEKHNHKNHK